MEKIFNVILIISVLSTLYLCIQKYKNENNCLKNNQIKEIKQSDNIEPFNTDKIFINPPIKSNNINFNYELREIDKQFLKEQDRGVNLNTWYPNICINSIDANGNPIYNSREQITGNVENFIETKALFSYEFNEPRTVQMNGVYDPLDNKNIKGKTLKEVYDNSFVNFKKLIPKKTIISSEPNTNYLNGASNLSFITPDTWVYNNEKPENGGEIFKGFYAADPDSIGSVAIFE